MSKYNTVLLAPSSNYACTPSGSYVPCICNSRRVTGCTLNALTNIIETSASFNKTGIEVGKVVRDTYITPGTTIVAIIDDTHIEVDTNPTTTISGRPLYIEHPDYADAPMRPSVEEDSGPMENLLTQDTAAPWVVGGPTGSTETTVTVDVDLKRNVNIGTLGLLGVVKNVAFPSLTGVYYRTSAQGYDGDGSWATLGGTLSFGAGANVGWTTAGQTGTISARYVRFVWGFTQYSFVTRWSVGKLLIGGLVTLLGYLYGPNTGRGRVPARLSTKTADGTEYVTQYGNTRRSWSLVFPRLNYTEMARFDEMGDTLYPYVWFDGMTGTWYEVRATGPAAVKHLYGMTGDELLTSDLFSVDLNIVSV